MALRTFLRRHGDEVVATVLAVAYAVEVLAYEDADHALAVPLAVASGVLLGLLRRRAPLVSFLAVSASNFLVLAVAPGFDSNSVMFVVVFLLNLYSLGRHARGLEAWLGVLGVTGTVVGFLVGDGAHQLSDVFFALAFCGTPWGAGVAVRIRHEREGELTARNEELRRGQEERERQAVADERGRIARELHDVVSHAIAVTVLQARGGRRLVGADDQAVRRALDAIEQTNTQALADMRRLLLLLRETDGDGGRDEPQPSLDRLAALFDQVRDSGLALDVEMAGEPRPVPPGVDLSAYRIVQEALTNVLKHGGPRARACVRVAYGEEGLDVDVRNTGAAPARNGSPGHGLIGIRERVSVVGGSVEAGPTDEGYAVRAHLPYGVTP